MRLEFPVHTAPRRIAPAGAGAASWCLVMLLGAAGGGVGCSEVTFVHLLPKPDETEVPSGGVGGATAVLEGGTGGAGGAGAEPGPFQGEQPFDITTDAACPDDLSLTEDLLEVVFDSDAFTLLHARRDSASAPWPLAIALDVGFPGGDTGAEISRDGLTLWWSSSRPPGGGGNFDLWFAERPGRDVVWATADVASALNTDALEGYPTLSEDSLTMIFVSDRGGGIRHLHLAKRSAVTEPWTTPVLMVALSAPEPDAAPHLSADGLTLYFSSARAGGAGGQDLYRAWRARVEDDFASVQPLSELNTALDESDPWVSRDERLIVFARENLGMDCQLLWAAR